MGDVRMLAEQFSGKFNHEGYTAYEQGKQISSNPYPRETTAGYRWEEGWMNAQFDNEGPPF